MLRSRKCSAKTTRSSLISESVGALFKAKRSLETMTPAERTARAKKAAAAAGQCGGAGEEGEETERGHEMTEKDVITRPELGLETVPDLPALRVFRTPFAPVNCSLRRRRWWRESPC